MAKVEYDLEEQVSRVVKAVQPDLIGMCRYELFCLSKIVESPIEVALGATIIMKDRIDPATRGNHIIICGNNEIDSYRPGVWLMVPQYQWQGFRIDLAVRTPSYRFRWVFIECDGHNFHERTKEQAARDRQKDREIQAAGIPILRFTGSEIHRDLDSCGEQFFQFLEDRMDDYIPFDERE